MTDEMCRHANGCAWLKYLPVFAKKTPGAQKTDGLYPPHPKLNVEDVLPGVDPDEKKKRPITRKVMGHSAFNIDLGGLGGNGAAFRL